ncbi:flavodoxin domain-containing protein [Burkholderiaceae bacterium DAT-1]|nr:flavodoxin domain-containing protein [Burkholderiaceae bacterium DAT-1]
MPDLPFALIAVLVAAIIAALSLARHAVLKQCRQTVLVTYASQSGTAYTIAKHTVAHLQHIGLSTRLRPIHALKPTQFGRYAATLIIASSFGQGEPPDHARPFHAHLAHSIDLSDVCFAVLALGDHRYQHFCQFGRSIAAWMQANGAKLICPVIEVDNECKDAVEAWYKRIQKITIDRH